jgi:hypothetical protein
MHPLILKDMEAIGFYLLTGSLRLYETHKDICSPSFETRAKASAGMGIISCLS